MSELAILEKRRQLVELSADLQRATLSRRLTAIEQRPRLAAFSMLASIGSRPGVRKLVMAAAVMGFRAWRRRKSRH
jgi:hypothetical protein